MTKGVVRAGLLVMIYWCSAIVVSWPIGGYVLAHIGWWGLLLALPLIFLIHALLAMLTVRLAKGW